MRLIIDRFEGNYAVCEMEDEKIVSIDKKIIPNDAKEGFVLDLEIKINFVETERIKKEIRDITRGIWE